MPVNQISMTAPTDWTALQEDIERKRRLADLLTQQGMQPMEGAGAVNGIPVQTSWTNGLARMLQAYMGAQGQKSATEEQRALGQEYQRTGHEALVKGLQAYQGTPAQPGIPVPSDEAGGGPGYPDQPAVPGSPTAAMAAWGSHPMTAGASQAMLAQMLKQETFGHDVKFTADGKPYIIGDKGGVKYLEPGITPREKQEPVTATDFQGNPVTKFVNPYQPQGDIRQPVKNEMVNRGPIITPVNPFTQTSPLTVGVSPNTVATNAVTMRGQDMGVNPALQGSVAQAKAVGTTLGNATAQASLDLPQAVATADQTVKLIHEMIGDATVDKDNRIVVPKGGKTPHPGFSVSVGASVQPGAQYISGTDKASFYALKDQVLGGAFMEAYKSLKGGGQITEIEGSKATAAITRMSTSQSEAEFVKAAKEFENVVGGVVNRIRMRASGIQQRRATDNQGSVLKFDEQGNPIP